LAESKAVGSPVTHELDAKKGRSTPGFGLPTEELDILAADDRDAESGGGALATVERLAVAPRTVCATMVILPRRLRAREHGARRSLRGFGGIPRPEFL